MTETNLQTPREAERPVIGGKYVLDKMLGQGGYSWVYLAKHKNIEDLEYVVKLLKPNHLGNDQVLRRFEQEATTLARIRSPHIARIVDYGPTENGIPYIVSEYIKGVTLGLVLRESGELSPWLTAHLGCQVLEGLQDAHKAGVVHRDLKPDNILITEQDGGDFPAAMVLDFGIAKVTQDASDDADATVEGLACSPRYAAPEVLTREPSFKSDIYAVGLVLAEMLIGHPVFRGKHNLILASEQLSEERVPLPDDVLTGPLGAIISRACEKQQEKRFADVTEMLEELREMRQTLMPFSEAAKDEIDLTALIALRNEGHDEDADTTALTENLHTFEAQNTGSGTVNIEIDELIKAQKAGRMNRLLVPLLIAQVLAVLVGIAAVVYFLNRPKAATHTSTAGTAVERAPDHDASPTPPVVDMGSAMRHANTRIHNALGHASSNNLSLTANVPGATLWLDGNQVATLPIKHVVTGNGRPVVLRIQAEGYDPTDFQLTQSGYANYKINLQKTPEKTTTHHRSHRVHVVRDKPSKSHKSAAPKRSGDYFDNPF